MPETFSAVVTVWYPAEVQQRIAIDSLGYSAVVAGQVDPERLRDNFFVRINGSAVACADLLAEYGYPIAPNEVERRYPEDFRRHYCLVQVPLAWQ